MAELRQLRVFVAVAEDLNFTRAAARLHLTQQAVSRTVTRLERELGVVLLDRTTHTVSLTRAGEALLGSGREALAAVDAALEHARAVGRGTAGTVSVGVTPALGPVVRARITAALRRAAPTAQISIIEVRPHQLVPLLRERDLDLIVSRTSPASPHLDSAALHPTPAVLHVPERHRLAGSADVRLVELDGERLMCWGEVGTPYTDLLIARLAAAGARVEPVISQVLGGGDAPDLTAQRAVALLPTGSLARPDVVTLPLVEPVDLPLLVLWLAGPPPPAVAHVRAALGSPRTGQ